VVAHVQAAHGVSERRSCGVLDVDQGIKGEQVVQAMTRTR